MAFQKRRVEKKSPKKYVKKTYNKKRSSTSKKHKKRGIIGKIILWFFLLLFIFGCVGSLIIYKKYIEPLPEISELENLEIAEASIIYDREWNELYKIFEEKRIYKTYDDISTNMIRALVAGEDKRFFENPGVDFIGLTRAVLYRVIGKSDKLEGTSTLTQQLIRNMIITNERTAERKIKEMYLAYKLTNSLSKEKILELYLNKISFWSNAFGIEQAAQTFFGKSSKDLGILESSMLASLPKGPSYYSPYSNFDRLVGYPYIYNNEDSENPINLITKSQIDENADTVNKLKDFISGFRTQRFSDSQALICGLDKDYMKSNISVDKDGCAVIDYSDLLSLLNAIKIQDGENTIEYQTGRKDFILWRMLEDKYITFDQYKVAVLDSIWFEFESYREDIKYPHFVFYVREYLEEKYGRELLERGGLRIYTSIDPKLQDEAEKIVEKYAANNEAKFAAQNAALVSLDNETWEILAMVGGRDYFDEENKWNNNIVTSRLQPGSSFKPFVYSMAIDAEIIGTKTPIYDLKTNFPGWYQPANFDWEFMGKMNVSTALNHSRNIPAVKMFYLAWGEEKIIKWMEALGVTSIREYKNEYFENYGKEYTYGASMSLWTAMMTPLELAQSYSVYANMGYKKPLVPVVKILDARWLVVEEFNKDDIEPEKVMDPSTAFITNHILSDTSARPEFWNSYLSLRGRAAAAKTGTSTKQYQQGGKKVILPRNLWTVWYTPQVTTIVWAWNNDGSETNYKWNGLEWAGPIWKDFMEFYHKDKWAINWKRPSGVKQVDISSISGLLAPEDLEENLRESSLFIHAPQNMGSGLAPIQVDLLCNGAVDKTTPISAIGNVQLLSFHSLKPENSNWELPVQEWVSKWEYVEEIGNIDAFITSVNTQTCTRTHAAANIEIGASIENGDVFVNGSNYIEIWYRSDQPLKSLDILIDETKIKQIDLWGKKQWVYVWDLNIPKGNLGNKQMVIRAIDNEYYSDWTAFNISIVKRDSNPPEITITNPIDRSISLYQGDFFNLRWEIEDRGGIRSINIYMNGTPMKIWLTGRDFVQEIGWDNLELWTHEIKIEAVDMDFNIGTTTVKLEVLER